MSTLYYMKIVLHRVIKPWFSNERLRRGKTHHAKLVVTQQWAYFTYTGNTIHGLGKEYEMEDLLKT